MYNPSYPNSSNDPHDLPFSTTIKQACRRACVSMSLLWSRIKRYYSIAIQKTPTTPNLNSIMRMRFMTSCQGRSRSQLDILPLYVNALEIEMQNYQSEMPMNSSSTTLGKTNLSLTFQAVLALSLTLHNSSSLDQPHLLTLQIVQSVIMIAFAVSYSGILLRHVYPKTANAFEKVGSVVAAMGLCLLSSFFLSGYFTWVSWLACAFCILASVIYIFH